MNVRWLTVDDAPQLAEIQKEKAEGLTLPKGCTLAGAFRGEKLVSVIGIVRPVVVDYLVSRDPSATKTLIAWLDGKLDPEPYYGFVSNPRLSEYIQHEYGDVTEQFDGKLLIRRRP